MGNFIPSRYNQKIEQDRRSSFMGTNMKFVMRRYLNAIQKLIIYFKIKFSVGFY